MHRLFVLAALAALACSSSSASRDAQAPAHGHANGNGAAPAKPESAPSDEDRAAIELADSIQADVERVHGLKFLRPVKKGVYDRERLAGYLKKQLDEEGADSIATEQRVLQLFGLLPAGYDLQKEMTDLLLEQIGGFYDPDARELYILRGFEGFLAKILMAHELCHALDDQHFDLKSTIDRLEKDFPDDDDRTFAARAVIEGSATDLMNAWVLDAVTRGEPIDLDQLMDMAGAIPMEKAAAAPPILVRPLMEAYTGGARFLTRGKSPLQRPVAKKKDVRLAFESLPLSSEQVLHPEKYWTEKKRDDPREVALPDLAARLGAGWSRKDTNVLGELGVAILTAPPEEPTEPDPNTDPKQRAMAEAMKMMMGEKSTPAAQGWDGDRYAYFAGPGGAELLVWGSVWDSEKDAAEIVDALRAPEGVVLVKETRGDRAVAVYGRNLPRAVSAESIAALALSEMGLRDARPNPPPAKPAGAEEDR